MNVMESIKSITMEIALTIVLIKIVQRKDLKKYHNNAVIKSKHKHSLEVSKETKKNWE